jgi:acetylornithine deacetylase
MRVATYPAQNLKAACAELEACIAEAARADSFLANRPPKVVYNGFLAEGYVLSNAEDLEAALRRSHVAVWNAPLQEHVTSATTDARFFGLYADTPAIVYGPICRMPHGYDEAVDLDSVLKVTQTLALFVADWCSLEPLSEERSAS